MQSARDCAALGCTRYPASANALGHDNPKKPPALAVGSVTQLVKTIELVRDKLDARELRISGVVCTLYDYTNVADDVYNALVKQFGDRMFKTRIPKNVSVEEAHSRSQSIFDYAPQSKGSQAYGHFVKEVISHG